MPDNVTFNLIPSALYVPGVFFEINAITKGLRKVRSNVLIIGQRLESGTLAAETIAPISSAAEAAALCGRGSIGHLMAAAALAAHPYGDHRVVMLADADDSTAAAGSVVFSGTSSAAGTVALYIGGVYIPVNVASGTAPAAIATAVAAAINAKLDLPVTAAVDGGVDEKVNITARNSGTLCNGLDIRVNYQVGQVLPAGVTVSVNAMTGGAGDPDITDAIAAMGDGYYAAIIMPFTDSTNMSALESELVDRFGPMKQIAATAYTAISKTYSQALTWSSTRNCPHCATLPMKASPTPAFVIAAVLGAVCERERSNDPARQMTTVELPGVLPPVVADRFAGPERNVLVPHGLSTYTVTSDNRVLLETVATNYQKDAFGIESESYLYIETRWAVDYVRMTFVDRIYTQFIARRMKLASENTQIAAGQLVAKPSDVRNEIIAAGFDLEKAGIIEGWATASKSMLIVRSTADTERVNGVVPVDIINNFRRFAGAVNYEV